MPLTYGNRIKVRFSGSVGPSTGDFILGTPVSGYQSFASAGIANTNTVRYVIEEGSAWEIGTGQYLSAGPKVVRTVIQSSAGVGVLVDFTPAATIMVSVAAGDFLPSDGGTVTGTVVLPSTTSIGTVSSTEIGYLDGVTSGIQTQLNDKAPTASPTLTGTIALSGAAAFSSSITEAVYAIPGGSPFTPSIDPTLGTIQTWTLGASSSPTINAAFTTGESVTLMIDDGTAYAITWPGTVQWKTDGGLAPMLNATGATAVVLWNVGGTVYGARVGNA